MDTELATKIDRSEGMLAVLMQRQTVKDWYGTEEFARLVGKAEFAMRKWCRLGRIQAQEKASGLGKYASWVIRHEELPRFQREGLLDHRCSPKTARTA